MLSGSHDAKAPKREHPLVVTGIVMIVLLAMLLALPFVSRLLHLPAKPIAVTPNGGVTPTSPSSPRVRDF